MNAERKLSLALAIFALLSAFLSFGAYQLRQKVEALETELVKVKKVNAWCQDAADTCKKLPAFPRVSYWCEQETKP